MIWSLIIGGLWKPIAALLAIAALYLKGRTDAKAKAKSQTLQAEVETHDRINQADTGIGATDGERIARLRDFAAKHGNR